MLTIVQRVIEASVTVDGKIVGQIGRGLVALVSVVATDTSADVDWTESVTVRVFPVP
jgi:D-tyrosyl-tRNA(Tyr) deacylase